jgi:biopolymer transport protein ExbD
MYKIPSRRRKKPQEQKINLIPILDGIFILIFFILSAAQFVKLKEIGSDLPVYRLAGNDDIPKKEFSLKVIISESDIQILNDEKNELLQKFNIGDVGLLTRVTEFLLTLKSKFPEENKAKIKVTENYNYQSLVKVLDAIRQSRNIEGETQVLFNQLMFIN